MRLRFAMFLGFLGVFTVLPRAIAQSSPSLNLQLSSGTARVNVTGDIGSPLTFQFTTNFISGPWLFVSNFTLLANPTQINTGPATNARYYRAVIVVPTNMIWLPPGTFLMGSPTGELERSTSEAQHSVTLTRGFFIGKYPVTQGNYRSLINTNPSYFNTNNGYALDLNRPVEQVSWSDATNYCALLTLQERSAGRIFTNWVYRLPSEAEWEYACRSGTTTPFYFGNSLTSGMANFFGQYGYVAGTGSVYNSSGVYLARTTAVGNYQPNSRAIYDMSANVWEWCRDWFTNLTTSSAIDPTGPSTGEDRVLRGGAFNNNAKDCRSASRISDSPSDKVNTVGFRVVLSAP
jgi:formylglycine-generating enzyme required for sulfatase activity